MIRPQSPILYFLGLIVACSLFALWYWMLARFHGGNGGLAEAFFWSGPAAGLGYVASRSRAGRRGLFAWVTILFCAMLLFQYWSLSMNDFFSIGSRVVYDQGFTSFGFFLLIYVPSVTAALSWTAVRVASIAMNMLTRSENE